MFQSDLLQGKVVLITGGGTGLGRSMGERFLQLGARLAISAEALFKEGGFGAFKCSIEHDTVLATAIVNTYQPSDDAIAQIKARMAGA